MIPVSLCFPWVWMEVLTLVNGSSPDQVSTNIHELNNILKIITITTPEVDVKKHNTSLLYFNRFFRYLYFTWVFIFLTTFHSSFPHLNTNIWTFSLLHFPDRLVTLVWMLLLPCWLCSRRFTNPKCRYLTFWEWDSTINSFFGAFRKSSDESYWFYL